MRDAAVRHAVLILQIECLSPGRHPTIILATGLEPRGSPKAAQEQPKGSPGAALGAAQGKPNRSPRASSLLHPVERSETKNPSSKVVGQL